MKDIRQRDMEIHDGYCIGTSDRFVPSPSVVIQKRNNTTKYSIFNPLIFMILFLLGLACTLVGTYRSGYKQAKIDYHIKP